MLDNPVTPRRPLITYARRDRERYFAERAAREQEYAAREQERAAREHLETLRQLGGEEAAARRPSSPRRSLRLRPFRPESARELVRDEGHTIHALVNGCVPCPALVFHSLTFPEQPPPPSCRPCRICYGCGDRGPHS
jgi:hypothetical protein